MSDTQQRKDPRETYPTNSASEDDEATLQPTKKISPQRGRRAHSRHRNIRHHGCNHLGEESANQSEPAASSEVEEEHRHHHLLCAQGLGGLVLQAGLESSQIALILCFIVTHMHSNLITKFGLIWWLDPPELLVLKSELFYWQPPAFGLILDMEATLTEKSLVSF